MTTPSPSEFLTFMRHVSRPVQSACRQSLAARPLQLRQSISPRTFVSSARLQHTGSPKPKEHVTDKKDRLDIHAEASGKGMDSKQQGGGDSTTSEKDTRGSTAKAKKEHPEAPDVIIGMQDERGQRGH